MGRFHPAEAGRVLAEERLHRGVLQRCEKILANYVIKEPLRPKVDDRGQFGGSLLRDRHLERQQAMLLDVCRLTPGILCVDDLDARDAALAERPIEFCRDAACGAGGSDYDQSNPAAGRTLGRAQWMLVETAAQAVLGAEHDQSGFV